MTTELKVKYYASSALTFTTLGSLAADQSLLAGACSLAVDNTTNLYDDYELSGNFKTGASAANTVACSLEVWIIPMLDDTNWPDVFLGTDAAKTCTSLITKYGSGFPAGSVQVGASAANNLVLPFKPVSVLAICGYIPAKFSVFVTHNLQTTTAALAAASSTVNICSIKGLTYTNG
jgi:hypothetical protein